MRESTIVTWHAHYCWLQDDFLWHLTLLCYMLHHKHW